MNPKAVTIESLLAKAESTDNQAEAEAFTAKAEELMVKHGIDAAMLAKATEGKGKVAEEILTETIVFKGTYSKPLQLGAYAMVMGLTDAIVCYATRTDRGKKRLTLAGYASDVQRAVALIRSLEIQAQTAMTAWWKAEGKRDAALYGLTSREQLVRRRGFLTGYFREAGDRLCAIRENAMATASAGTDVALVDRRSQVKSWVNSTVGPLGKARNTRGATDFSGQRAGRVAGAKADIGQTRVGQRGRIGA